MKYFQGVNDFAQAKVRYRILAMKMHPDRGGCTCDFQNMKEEYSVLLTHFKEQRETNSASDFTDYSAIIEELKNLGLTDEFITSATQMVGRVIGNAMDRYKEKNPESQLLFDSLKKLLN